MNRNNQVQVEAHLFATFKALAGRSKIILELQSGQTIHDAYYSLLQALPMLRSHWLDSTGHPQQYVHVYLNQQDSTTLPDGMLTKIQDGDILDFIPPVAGG